MIQLIYSLYYIGIINSCINLHNTGRKLHVHKMFIRRPGHLSNAFFTFNLRPVFRGEFELICPNESFVNPFISLSEITETNIEKKYFETASIKRELRSRYFLNLSSISVHQLGCFRVGPQMME